MLTEGPARGLLPLGTQEERAIGCLLGLAVGDALGFPLEGLKPSQIERRFPDLEGYRFLGSRGYVSDDTEQAVMVAETLLDGGDPARGLGRRLVAWFWTAPPGIGMATLKACLKWTVGIRRGVASAGNGAAMRAAPVGLWPGYCDALARSLAEVTHTDPRGVDGARLVSAAVHRLVRGESADWPALAPDLELDPRLRESMERAWDSRALAPEERARLLGTSGYVLHSVPLAFSALWSEAADFASGLLGVVRQGGDADSTGAVAGALLGARWGARAIPAPWVANLEPAYGRPRLETLALALLAGQPPPDLLEPGFAQRRGRELAIKAGVALHALRRLLPW